MAGRNRWSAALAAIALAVLAAALYSSVAPIDWRLGPFRLRSADPVRAGVLAVGLALAAVVCAWRSRNWRRLTLGTLAVSVIATLAVLAHGGPERWPTADAAMTELFTVHATHGEQLLGAYSQFGWVHPGPMLFYWLAPFYVVGGRTITGLAAPSLVLNLISMWICAAIAVRRAPGVPLLPIALIGLIGLLIYRLPGFVTSAWNPHIALLPAVALLPLTAAVIDGDASAFPLVALFASFVAQVHVGLAPLGVAAGAVATLATAWQIIHDDRNRARTLVWAVVTVALVEVLWLLPLAQQLTAHPGNMTKLYRFFLEGSGGNTLDPGFAWRIWGSTMAGLIDPAFALPIGHPISDGIARWLPVAGTVLAGAMLPSAWLLRRRSRYAGTLALVVAGAAVLSLWSVRHVRGTVGDYHVFWIAGIGLVGLATAASAIGVLLADRPEKSRLWHAMTWATAMLVTAAVMLSAIPGMLDRPGRGTSGDSEQVRVITAGLFERLAHGVKRPRVRVDADVWVVGAGVILQLAKKEAPFAVEDPVLFGDALTPRGDEDSLVEISGPERHGALIGSGSASPVIEAEGVFADLLRPVGALDAAP